MVESEVLVGVVEGEEPSSGLLGAHPGVRYTFIDPSEPTGAEASHADALFIWNVRGGFLHRHWHEFDRLRWVHTATAGVEHLLFPELVTSDVVVTNSRFLFDQALAEYTIGLMLCLSKDFGTTILHQTQHRWDQRGTETLAGKVAVMVGVGPIARRTAHMAKALGMTVRGVGRTPRDGDPDFGDIVASTHLVEALAGADYVVVVLPGTPSTAGLVDAATIRSLKPTARLINVGRAATLDQDALAEALRAGRLAGAALDVVSPEPLPADDPLWDVPNLIISPHMSGDHKGWRDEAVAIFERNLERWRSGEPLLNVIDKHLGYAPRDNP